MYVYSLPLHIYDFLSFSTLAAAVKKWGKGTIEQKCLRFVIIVKHWKMSFHDLCTHTHTQSFHWMQLETVSLVQKHLKIYELRIKWFCSRKYKMLKKCPQLPHLKSFLNLYRGRVEIKSKRFFFWLLKEHLFNMWPIHSKEVLWKYLLSGAEYFIYY